MRSTGWCLARDQPVDVHRSTDAVLAGIDRVARNHPNVAFVATTNFPSGVDPAFLSRADLIETIGPPNADAAGSDPRGQHLGVACRHAAARRTSGRRLSVRRSESRRSSDQEARCPGGVLESRARARAGASRRSVTSWPRSRGQERRLPRDMRRPGPTGRRLADRPMPPPTPGSPGLALAVRRDPEGRSPPRDRPVLRDRRHEHPDSLLPNVRSDSASASRRPASSSRRWVRPTADRPPVRRAPRPGGERRLAAIGVVLLAAGSVVEALAPSVEWLMLARVTSGLGSGLLTTVTLTA